MFSPLHDLARTATLMVVISAEGDQLRVNVTPTQLSDKTKAHYLRPLSLLGTPEELDAEFATALAEWQAPKRSLVEQARDAAGSEDAPKPASEKAGKPKSTPAPAAKAGKAGRAAKTAPAVGAPAAGDAAASGAHASGDAAASGADAVDACAAAAGGEGAADAAAAGDAVAGGEAAGGEPATGGTAVGAKGWPFPAPAAGGAQAAGTPQPADDAVVSETADVFTLDLF